MADETSIEESSIYVNRNLVLCFWTNCVAVGKNIWHEFQKNTTRLSYNRHILDDIIKTIEDIYKGTKCGSEYMD